MEFNDLPVFWNNLHIRNERNINSKNYKEILAPNFYAVKLYILTGIYH